VHYMQVLCQSRFCKAGVYLTYFMLQRQLSHLHGRMLDRRVKLNKQSGQNNWWKNTEKRLQYKPKGTLRQWKNSEETLWASEVGKCLIAYIMKRRNMIRNKMKYSALYYLFVTAATNSDNLLCTVQKIMSQKINANWRKKLNFLIKH
jgi:hypothetical protein